MGKFGDLFLHSYDERAFAILWTNFIRFQHRLVFQELSGFTAPSATQHHHSLTTYHHHNLAPPLAQAQASGERNDDQHERPFYAYHLTRHDQ